jgi:hypothetical protein
MIDIPAEWDVEKIGEIFKIEYGNRIVFNKSKRGKYPVFGSGNETFSTDKYNRENRLIVSRFAISKKCVSFVNNKFYLNDSGLTINSLQNCQKFIDHKFYSMNNEIYRIGQGSAQINLDMKYFRRYNITIPQTLKEQENIANILTKQDSIISSIEERIKLETQVIKYFTQEELSGRLRLKLTNNSIDELIKYGIIKPINITKTKDDLNNKESISSQTIPLSEINGNEVIKNNKSYDINSIEVVEGQEDELVDYLIGKGNFSNNDNNGFDKKIEFYLNDDWKNVKLNPRKLKIPIDWCVLNTRDYFSFKRGKVISKEYMNNNKGIYPVYSSATLNNGQIGSIDTYTENYNCITWTTDGYAGKLNKRNGKFNVTNICGILKPKKSIDLDFYVSIAQKDVYLMRATTYSNSKVMTSHIEKVKFVSPQTKLEQILISTHLTSRNDIKEELTLELTKQKEVFKYLNQELLSGRLRVK